MSATCPHKSVIHGAYSSSQLGTGWTRRGASGVKSKLVWWLNLKVSDLSHYLYRATRSLARSPVATQRDNCLIFLWRGDDLQQHTKKVVDIHGRPRIPTLNPATCSVRACQCYSNTPSSCPPPREPHPFPQYRTHLLYIKPIYCSSVKSECIPRQRPAPLTVRRP